VWKSGEDLANPIMTCTELFIDGKHELYMLKNSWSDLLERGREKWLRCQNTWELKPMMAAYSK